ncbi:hypothetical protein BKA57DRAFT_496378, partial [Linnemannia elongata]
ATSLLFLCRFPHPTFLNHHRFFFSSLLLRFIALQYRPLLSSSFRNHSFEQNTTRNSYTTNNNDNNYNNNPRNDGQGHTHTPTHTHTYTYTYTYINIHTHTYSYILIHAPQLSPFNNYSSPYRSFSKKKIRLPLAGKVNLQHQRYRRNQLKHKFQQRTKKIIYLNSKNSLQITRPVFFKTLSPLDDQSRPQTETGIKRTNWANKRGKSTSNPTQSISPTAPERTHSLRIASPEPTQKKKTLTLYSNVLIVFRYLSTSLTKLKSAYSKHGVLSPWPAILPIN